MDAREVTMHYKRKGDRVDEVLHDIVLNHVNRLEHENKRLREELDTSEKHLMTVERHLRDFKKFEFEERTEKERLREALEYAQSEIIPIRGFERKDIDGITSVCIKIRKVLEGEDWE